MIDFHTHLLPSVDDGATDLSVSEKILNLLEADGVNKVVCTPHFYWRDSTVKGFLQKREHSFGLLSQTKLTLVLGAEVQFGERRIDYAAFPKLKIGSTRYIMLELPSEGEWSDKLYANIDGLIRETDLIPVIAHVERYFAVRKNPSNINKLVKHGCILQVNADSIISAKPRGLVNALLSHGFVQAVGTDCHNGDSRAPHYAQAMTAIKENYGVECFDYIQKSMSDMLENKRVKCYGEHTLRKLFNIYF